MGENIGQTTEEAAEPVEKYLFSNNAFYPLALQHLYIDAGTWPDSGVWVESDVFEAFTVTPPPGKMRSQDEAGGPIWIEVPPLTDEERLASIERQRQQLLSLADVVTSDWRTELALGDISDADREKLSAWMAYKREVKSVKAGDAVAEGFKWPPKPV